MKHPIRRRFMYLGFQGLRLLAQTLPLPVACACGRAVGSLAYWLLPSQRRLCLTHLGMAFGDTCTVSQRKAITKRLFRHLGQNGVEWLSLPKLSLQAIQQLVTGEGVEHLRQALAAGNGAIIVTAHFGNWELIPLYLRSLGFEGGVVARRLRYPEYESFLITLRGSRGVPTYARGSLKEVARVLRANQIIGLLPDQDMESLEGIFIPFFGRTTYTPIGPAALSLMTGAPILPCFMIREQERFRLVVEPPVGLPPATDRAHAVAALTQAWSQVVESYIRRYPDHWVWMHRRWKTQPTPKGSSQPSTVSTAPTPATAPHPPNMIGGSQPALSVVLAALCCLLGAALFGCSKTPTAPPKLDEGDDTPAASAPSSPAGAPQQEMSGLTLTGYAEDGSKRWELEGQEASLDGQVATLQHPNGIIHDPDRKVFVTASIGHLHQANRRVRLEHEVTIHTSDGLWFSSPSLYWLTDQDRGLTDDAVRIETDHMLLRGRGAAGFMQLKQMTVQRDVEMVLNPTDHERAIPVGHPSQVTITCDGPLAFDYEHGVATFEQNVHVKDPNGDLYSDKLVAYLDQATRTIRYAEATGRVRIHQEQNTALSERAIYEPSVGKITLVGKPSLLVYPSQGSGGTPVPFGGLAASSEPARQHAAATEDAADEHP